jgi:hypothetical protein
VSSTSTRPDTAGGHRPTHTVLLAAEIPVVEHLTNLDRQPAFGATSSAVPPTVRGLATFPDLPRRACNRDHRHARPATNGSAGQVTIMPEPWSAPTR